MYPLNNPLFVLRRCSKDFNNAQLMPRARCNSTLVPIGAARSRRFPPPPLSHTARAELWSLPRHPNRHAHTPRLAIAPPRDRRLCTFAHTYARCRVCVGMPVHQVAASLAPLLPDITSCMRRRRRGLLGRLLYGAVPR